MDAILNDVRTRGAARSSDGPEAEGPTLWKETQGLPKPLDRPPGSRVLVLAPHMDDDVLGCGGSLRRHVLAGDTVTIAYLTDGRKGDPRLNARRLSFDDRERLEDRLVAVRCREAKRSAAVLGVRDLRFLGYRDQELAVSAHARRQVADLLEELRPDLVYLPFPTDRHPDHRMTNRIFLAALSVVHGVPEPLCCGYEVWTPIEPNCLVDITSVLHVKRRALVRFKSQMSVIDFGRCIIGLHAYRSMIHLRGHGYAEAFVLLSADEYRRQARRILARAGKAAA